MEVGLMKKEPSNKTLLYMLDPDETYTYNVNHGTAYPYNGFPTGMNGRKYKKTRFINWEPIPEDIIIRHHGSQLFVNFTAVFPNDVIDPNIQIFQMRSKKLDLQNYICEQINFFTALYDDDNDLITSMLIAKYLTDSQTFTIVTFDEYYHQLYDILFPERTMDKIKKMVEENDIGDTTIGLFPLDFLRDMYIVSFMIKVMHIFIEHFIIGTGNSPKDLYELFAEAYTYIMNNINPNMYVLLYNYVSKSVDHSISSNVNVYDMQAIDGVTAPTTAQVVMRNVLLCNGLIKLTFASAWDAINKRPSYSCVGLITSIVSQAAFLIRKTQLRYSLVNVDDVSQLLSDTINSNSPISMIRSFNPGEYSCIIKDLNIIIAQIALEIDLSHVDCYLENLTTMNDLSKILIDTVLYNKFHTSISTNTLSTKQKYILLLYVRHLVMRIYNLTEEDTKGNNLINILMGKTVSQTTKTLTQKDMNGIKKYIKLNNLKNYLLSDKNVNTFVENIMRCVLSSYTIVNHNDSSLLGVQLVYESGNMTLELLDMVVQLFEYMR
jgi:hypothetical protein